MPTQRAHAPSERYVAKLRKGEYVDLLLFEADEPEKSSFIKLEFYKGGKRSSVYLKKDKASFLCMQLQFLIQKGLELDMEELRPPISLCVKPKIERTVHVKFKAHAHENNMDISDAYTSLSNTCQSLPVKLVYPKLLLV